MQDGVHRALTTVERTNVEVYAEMARLLFKNLFGFELDVPDSGHMELLGRFMDGWSRLERVINTTANVLRPSKNARVRMMPEAFAILDELDSFVMR